MALWLHALLLLLLLHGVRRLHVATREHEGRVADHSEALHSRRYLEI